ncbi:MAG: MauE/DoxX family redox-associated membrane protein [Chitinophagaceae bacterium]
MNKYLLLDIFSSLLILLFVYTGISKLINFTTFKFQLGIFPFLHPFAGSISWILPTVEILISGMLILPISRGFGFFCSLVVLIIFTSYLIIMVYSGQHLPCSCGGVIEAMTWKEHILFNFFYIMVAWSGLVLSKKKTGVDKNKTPISM